MLGKLAVPALQDMAAVTLVLAMVFTAVKTCCHRLLSLVAGLDLHKAAACGVRTPAQVLLMPAQLCSTRTRLRVLVRLSVQQDKLRYVGSVGKALAVRTVLLVFATACREISTQSISQVRCSTTSTDKSRKF